MFMYRSAQRVGKRSNPFTKPHKLRGGVENEVPDLSNTMETHLIQDKGEILKKEHTSASCPQDYPFPQTIYFKQPFKMSSSHTISPFIMLEEAVYYSRSYVLFFFLPFLYHISLKL